MSVGDIELLLKDQSKMDTTETNVRPLLYPRLIQGSNDYGYERYGNTATSRHRKRQPGETSHEEDKSSQTLESADFEYYESQVFIDKQIQTHVPKKGLGRPSKRVAMRRWLLMFLVAVLTALTAAFITYFVRKLTDWKFDVVNKCITGKEKNAKTVAIAFSAYLAFATVYGAVAAGIVSFLSPAAAGSGISEIKCLLNGLKIPTVVRFKTLISKVIGILFSVSAGLPVGMEGPMIHSGAIIAAGISQGKSKFGGSNISWTKTSEFRNDREKRDFITCGAASGVAAAFGAPVGGVLFALEEGSSFWSKTLTWRSFFSAVVSHQITTYVLDIFLSGMSKNVKWGNLSDPGMFTFGDFREGIHPNKNTWTAAEIPVFILMGCTGGLVGALFVSVNKRLTRWRQANVTTSRRKFFQVLLVTILVAVLAFFIPLVYEDCKGTPEPHSQTEDIKLIRFFCNHGEYNPVATFFFTSTESAIKQLFHFEGRAWTLPQLLVFFIVYGSMTCLTYGIAVPSGLFIPSLLTGSAYGRFVGEVMVKVFGEDSGIDPRTYSLVGAAAVLGGVVRMTISLAVILIESTGNYQYALPMMVVFFSSRWAGNGFNKGIYDSHIDLNDWPLLEEKLPKQISWTLKVRDVAKRSPVVLREIETVERVVRILRSTTHHGFPVIFNSSLLSKYPSLGTLSGIIQRRHLMVLLGKRVFSCKAPATKLRGFTDRLNCRAQLKLQPAGINSLRIEERKDLIMRMQGYVSEEPRRDSYSRASVSETFNDSLVLSQEEIVKDYDEISLDTSSIFSEYSDILSSSGHLSMNAGTNKEKPPDNLHEPLLSKEGLKREENGSFILSDDAFIENFPHYPAIESIDFGPDDMNCYMDLRPYVNTHCYVIHEEATIRRAYALFRNIGLRHLPVVNSSYDVVSILTREDLVEDRLKSIQKNLEESYRV